MTASRAQAASAELGLPACVSCALHTHTHTHTHMFDMHVTLQPVPCLSSPRGRPSEMEARPLEESAREAPLVKGARGGGRP